MIQPGETAPSFPAIPGGRTTLVVFFEADCPTCQLALPYLNKLNSGSVQIVGIGQDTEGAVSEFIRQMQIKFPVQVDQGLRISQAYDPQSVPTIFLLDEGGKVLRTVVGFDKGALNDLAAAVGHAAIAPEHDGAPPWKPGCSSRHLEPETEHQSVGIGFLRKMAEPATQVTLADDEDPFLYCHKHFGDALPVVPPSVERVQAMLKRCGQPAQEVIARVPPCYGEATVEKIAANAVMAGCPPEMMRVLIPLVRAACDELFNLHGVQATTHFAAPLVIVNGPVRKELGFWSRQNVFSNVAQANSTLGRALQLVLLNIGGGRPDGIDMSTLGNPGKFSCCIAENEEENPWEPLHVERGFQRHQSTLTLFAGDPPRGVSEHNAVRGKTVLKTIARQLATVWSYRMCMMFEAVVVLCPEHVKTLHRDGFSKQQVKEFLFDNTGIPLKHFEDGDGEGTQFVSQYREIVIDGERCYQKFRSPEALTIVVAGGTAGKFSAVIGSWATGDRGSQMVTYPISDL